MLKPLSSIPVSLTGNVKIQNFVEIQRDDKGKDTDENLYWGTVREARLVPLSSSARYTNLMCNLLSSDYSQDISKFWGVYSDIFYSTEDNSNFTVYELLGEKPTSNYNTDFLWGCKRISFQKNRGCTHTFFAPLWTEGEIPDYFEIKIVIDNKEKESRKLRIPISKDIKTTTSLKSFNYLPDYVKRYCDKLDSYVVRLDSEGECSYIYGIDVQRGGFAIAQNRQAQKLWKYYNPVNSFDYTLSYQYKDAKYVVKQILPLAFSFNLDDLLLGSQKYSTNIKVSANYWLNGNPISLYRFDYNYTDFSYSYYTPLITKTDYSTRTIKNTKRTSNIFELTEKDTYNFCLYEGSVKQYKNTSQKYIPYYFKWQLVGSDDNNPYIINLNEEYNTVYVTKTVDLGNNYENTIQHQYFTNKYKVSGYYHIIPLPVLNSYGLFISKTGHAFYDTYPKVIEENILDNKIISDTDFLVKRTQDLITEYNNYCNNWYELPLYRTSEDSEENLVFNSNTGKITQLEIGGTKPVDKSGLIYYKGILYNLKNTGVKQFRVEHDIKICKNIFGQCYTLYNNQDYDSNTSAVVYSTDKYLNIFGSEEVNTSLSKIITSSAINTKYFINPHAYVSEDEYNSKEDISHPEIISEVVQLPFPVLTNGNKEELQEYYVKVPYLSDNKCEINLPEYFSLFRNTDKNWIEGKDSPYRHRLFKYTTNYDSSTENLYYEYKEVTRDNPEALDIFYKVKAKKVNIADYRDNSYFFTDGVYDESKENLLASCRIFNPAKACFEDTPVISRTYMTSENFERFFDEIISWYEKDSALEVEKTFLNCEEQVNNFTDTFSVRVNGILFEDIKYSSGDTFNDLLKENQPYTQEDFLFSEECLRKLNADMWYPYQKKPKLLFNNNNSFSGGVHYCGYNKVKEQVKKYQEYVEQILEYNYNLINSHIVKTTGNIILLNDENEKIKQSLTNSVNEYLDKEYKRVRNIISLFSDGKLKNYFEKLKENHRTINYTYRFSPINNIYDLENVFSRQGHLYIYCLALYLPQYYNFYEELCQEKSFQERMVYGFKLVKKNDEYYIKIPKYGYSSKRTSFSGVCYVPEKHYVKVDVSQLKEKSYISIYWTNPELKKGDLTELEKSYNEFILRYLYPWAGAIDENIPEESNLSVMFEDTLYPLYKALPELTGLEFKLYFLDEFISFNNLLSVLDKHFYDLLLSHSADGRYWYPETAECDKVLIPRLQHTEFADVEKETKFIFDQDCNVVTERNKTFINNDKENYSWDKRWNIRIKEYEKLLCSDIKSQMQHYNNNGSLSFFAKRELFMNEYSIESYKYALPFFNISGMNYPWICQQLPEGVNSTDLKTDTHEFKKFYSVRIPDVRIGFYKDNNKGLLRCNSLITSDNNSLNLDSKIQFTNKPLIPILEAQIEKNPLDVYFCLRRNPLVHIYDSEFSIKPQYYTLNEDFILSRNINGEPIIMKNEYKNTQRFLRYFGQIKPMLVPDNKTVYAWGKKRSDARQDIVETTLFQNTQASINYSPHVEKYVHKNINPVTHKFTYVEKERKLWEDKWFNDSKVLNLPLEIIIQKGIYKESQLNEVESTCQSDFNKYFRQKKFSDPELLKYLFFNYKVEYDTIPLGTDNKGEREYKLTFKFKLY